MTAVHAESDLTISKIKTDTGVTIIDENLNYLFANINDENIKAVSFDATKGTQDYSVVFTDNILVITYLQNTDVLALYTYTLNMRGEAVDRVTRCHSLIFDFNTNTFSATYADGSPVLFSEKTGLEFYNFETDFEQYKPNLLDLTVRFEPTMSGSISRSRTIDGKEYTSKSLDLYVTNNGNDAQFLWAIVPKGQTLSFPSLTEYNSQGFDGNPVYVYVSQEWTDYTEGFNGDTVLAPSSWHSIPSGYVNQNYSASWTQMMLSANTEYDCVVYACLNSNLLDTNYDPNSAWNVRGSFTVTCALNDVQEIYRSTFTISDPAEFNPNYIDEGNQTYPWNPNADNSSLFNVSNAYKDDTGNVVVRGQTRGGIDASTWSAWGDISDNNMNNIFRSYFSFLNGAMNCFPKAFIQLLTLGLSGLIVLGIIKVVIK